MSHLKLLPLHVLVLCSCTIYQSPTRQSITTAGVNECASIETKIAITFSPPEGSTLGLNDPYLFVADGFRADRTWSTGWVFIRDDDHEFSNLTFKGNYGTCALPSEAYSDAMVETNTVYTFLRGHTLKRIRFKMDAPAIGPFGPNKPNPQYQTEADVNWTIK